MREMLKKMMENTGAMPNEELFGTKMKEETVIDIDSEEEEEL